MRFAPGVGCVADAGCSVVGADCVGVAVGVLVGVVGAATWFGSTTGVLGGWEEGAAPVVEAAGEAGVVMGGSEGVGFVWGAVCAGVVGGAGLGGSGVSEANASSISGALQPTPTSSWRIMSSGTRTLLRVRIYWSICSSITKIIASLLAILRKYSKNGRVGVPSVAKAMKGKRAVSSVGRATHLH